MVKLLLFIIYLPFVATTSGQGVAGRPVDGDMWYHTWSACWPRDARCVDVFKSDVMEHEWTNVGAMERTVADCPSGYVMFGDEWELQGWPIERQVAALHWFEQVVQATNQDCKIIFGGTLVSHPKFGVNGPGWVHRFFALYRQWYGEPGIVGVAFDTYYWAGYCQDCDFVRDTMDMVDAVHQECPGCEVWAREIGSLVSHDAAVEAMGMLPQVTPALDRWAWFLAEDDGQWPGLGLWEDGQLTDLGRVYWGQR